MVSVAPSLAGLGSRAEGETSPWAKASMSSCRGAGAIPTARPLGSIPGAGTGTPRGRQSPRWGAGCQEQEGASPPPSALRWELGQPRLSPREWAGGGWRRWWGRAHSARGRVAFSTPVCGGFIAKRVVTLL